MNRPLGLLGLLSLAATRTVCQGDAERRPPPNATVVDLFKTSPTDIFCETEFEPGKPDVLWAELIESGNAIVRYDMKTKQQKRFPLRNPVGVPSGMEFLPDGHLWFSEVVGNNMVRLDPKDGSMTEYPFPFTNVAIPDNLPVGVRGTIDVSGNRDRGAWFVTGVSNGIGRLDIDTFKWDFYPIPTALSLPLVIQPGPGSTMVFSEALGNKVGTIDVHTRKIKEYAIPTPLSFIQGVTTDSDGLIWWTGTVAGTFGTVNVTTGEVTEIRVADLRAQGKSKVIGGGGLIGSIGTSFLSPFPGPIRQGSDGNIYFVEGNLVLLGNRIAQYDPRTGLLNEYDVPTSLSAPCDLNNQIPGSMTFGLFSGGGVGEITYSK